MTDSPFDPDRPHLAMKAIRARRMTDPLGAMGFRQTRSRIGRETKARKVAFLATLGLFTGLFGIVAMESQADSASAGSTPASISGAPDPSSPQQTDGTGFTRTVQVKPAKTHVRTKSS